MMVRKTTEMHPKFKNAIQRCTLRADELVRIIEAGRARYLHGETVIVPNLKQSNRCLKFPLK